MDSLFLLVLLALSGVFSGSETAYFSLRRTELAQMRDRGVAGRRVRALIDRSAELLAALLIGNLLVNIAASVVTTGICLRFFGTEGLAVAIPGATLALLLIGEITPKLLALRARVGVALFVQGPLSVWMLVVRPVQTLIGPPLRWLVHALPFERTGTSALTVQELQTACDLAVEEGALGEMEGRFLARLLGLRSLAVREIMTPRPDVVTLEAEWDRERILAEARSAGYNRYPVVVPERDMPVGLFHLKDLLRAHAAVRPLRDDLRALIFVPESKDAASLLTEMRTGGIHLAAVVDEHGDFTGIVTLADCLRALIGPVGDVGAAGADVIQIGAHRWVLSGGVDLRGLREGVGLDLPPSRNYVTLAGYLMARLGRIPVPGDRVSHDGWRLTVLEMSGHRVARVLAAGAPPAPEEKS